MADEENTDTPEEQAPVAEQVTVETTSGAAQVASDSSESPAAAPAAISDEARQAYWATNLRYLGGLLTIWFIVSYGCGILFVDELDKIRGPLGGFKLGFWFSQQGAIYVFVILIFVYTWLMNKLDQKYGVAED